MLRRESISRWGRRVCQGLLLLLFGALILRPGFAHSGEQVRYDPAADSLTVQAANGSLRQLLASVSLQSGVEILFPPAAERNITVGFEKIPLDAGLKRIAESANLSHFMVYQQSGEKKLLVRMKMVSSGQRKTGESDLAPALPISQEVVARARSAGPATATEESVGAENVVDDRWKSRLAELPKAQREKLEALAQRLEQKRAEQAIYKEERGQKRQERQSARLAREEARKAADPERYERIQQRRQAYAEQLGQ